MGCPLRIIKPDSGLTLKSRGHRSARNDNLRGKFIKDFAVKQIGRARFALVSSQLINPAASTSAKSYPHLASNSNAGLAGARRYSLMREASHKITGGVTAFPKASYLSESTSSEL